MPAAQIDLAPAEYAEAVADHFFVGAHSHFGTAEYRDDGNGKLGRRIREVQIKSAEKSKAEKRLATMEHAAVDPVPGKNGQAHHDRISSRA
ncbi:MAG: hypothetical protein WCD12_05615 [Candidatus Binatus sp.]|uniref:hypothetical protein n=1 Tax=Candidatus Binatus sp. TaxID=2811406 RepID=UPI003C7692C1